MNLKRDPRPRCWRFLQMGIGLLTFIIFLATTPCRSQPLINPQTEADKDEAWQTFAKNGVTIEFTENDRGQVARVYEDVSLGKRRVKAFFGKSFPQKFRIKVFPDRASLTAFWRKDWKMPDFQAQCWMVASGTEKTLAILSPRVWKTEACEHDPNNSNEIRMLIAHEMVHVFHDQMNPQPNFDALEQVSWFVEGLAVYASGQLENKKLASPLEAVTQGKAPTELENAWSGKYRYGVSGSIVQYIDVRYGRKKILQMLKGGTEAELLAKLKISEKELLENWQSFVKTGKK